MAIGTGLTATDESNPRLHFDIYAILETSQELYLGHEVQVNVNVVETIKLSIYDPDQQRERSLEKCYISPTKRRGVERRCLLWAPVKSGVLLSDKQECGIPLTCAKPDCPVCSAYGGLQAGKKTLIGRVTHGGGVAVQALAPQEKQRAMHPSRLASPEKGKDETPVPFKREYNQPGILYPVSDHALSLTEQEFSSIAYAFLDALPRIGSGNPKGVAIAEEPTTKMPLLVVDKYLAPRGKRPIISPAILDPKSAIERFIELARTPETNTDYIQLTHFERWIGDEALKKLQDYSSQFVETVLQAD